MKHYAAIKKYVINGPLLVDVNMASPNKIARSFMDSLLAFWPGLQVWVYDGMKSREYEIMGVWQYEVWVSGFSGSLG